MPLILQRLVRLEEINITSGERLAQVTLVTTNSLLNPQGRCTYTDGHFVYASYFNGTIERVAKCTPNGTTFTIDEDVAAPFLIGDATYDGVYFWCLGGTKVYRARDWKFSVDVASWTHGLASPASIVRRDKFVIVGSN